MKRLRAPVVCLLLVAGALWASASAYVRPDVLADTREVVLNVKHSRFSIDELHVAKGQRVRFVVRNDDPIDHELIVGPMAVQDRHESGTEPHHGARDGEVSVPLLATRSTGYTFDRAGTYHFGCHLPGHWAYGMRGRVVVS